MQVKENNKGKVFSVSRGEPNKTSSKMAEAEN